MDSTTANDVALDSLPSYQEVVKTGKTSVQIGARRKSQNEMMSSTENSTDPVSAYQGLESSWTSQARQSDLRNIVVDVEPK